MSDFFSLRISGLELLILKFPKLGRGALLSGGLRPSRSSLFAPGCAGAVRREGTTHVTALNVLAIQGEGRRVPDH